MVLPLTIKCWWNQGFGSMYWWIQFKVKWMNQEETRFCTINNFEFKFKKTLLFRSLFVLNSLLSAVYPTDDDPNFPLGQWNLRMIQQYLLYRRNIQVISNFTIKQMDCSKQPLADCNYNNFEQTVKIRCVYLIRFAIVSLLCYIKNLKVFR